MDQERSRSQQAITQQQAQPQYSNPALPSYNTVPAPPAAVNTPGLYPQPVAGLPIRGMLLFAGALLMSAQLTVRGDSA